MVREDREFLEQFMHEDASLVSCCCFPGRRSIEGRGRLCDLVEACRYVGRLLRLQCRSLVALCLESGRFRKAPFLLGEEVRADLVGVVQLEQLPSLPLEVGALSPARLDRPVRVALPGIRGPRPVEFAADRGAQPGR